MTSLYHLMADILAGCYAVTHNYALAIALLTLVAVLVTTPLIWKGTRGMLAMQMLAPEIKKLQVKYKGDKEALNREMMALYKENSINPLGGCLPLLAQAPVFFFLYRTIYNLSHRLPFTVPKGETSTAAAIAAHCPNIHGQVVGLIPPASGSSTWTCADPTNVSTGSHLYQTLVANGGHMRVWGFDLTLGVRTAHGSALIGCWLLVALVVGAYWIQTKQMSSRNPAAAAANPQMATIQKITPFLFGFFSFGVQAGVNVYFLVSALCRIGQQSLMYRHDPVLRRHVANAKAQAPMDAQSTEKKGFFASLQEAFGPNTDQAPGRRPSGGGPAGGKARPGGSRPTPPPRAQQNRPQQSGSQQSGGQQSVSQQSGSQRPRPQQPSRPAGTQSSSTQSSVTQSSVTQSSGTQSPGSSTPTSSSPRPAASRPASARTGAGTPSAPTEPRSHWSRIWAAASGADATAARTEAARSAQAANGSGKAAAGNGQAGNGRAGNGSVPTTGDAAEMAHTTEDFDESFEAESFEGESFEDDALDDDYGEGEPDESDFDDAASAGTQAPPPGSGGRMGNRPSSGNNGSRQANRSRNRAKRKRARRPR